MLPTNLRTLKRSISEKLLRGSKQAQKAQLPATIPSKAVITAPAQDDPYREFLRQNNDNVSHLVLHGSSLRSMTSSR